MRLSHPIILIPTACVIFVTSVLFDPKGRPMEIPGTERRSAPDITTTDTNGVSFRLSDYKGKVVLLNFWATWCEPCEAERPLLMQLQSAYDGKGFEVIGVATDADGPDKVPGFLALHRTNYRIVYGSEAIAEKLGGIRGFPTNVFIDRDGNIAALVTGYRQPPLFKKHPIQTLVENLILQGPSRPSSSAGGGANENIH